MKTLKNHKGGGCACSGSALGFPQTGGGLLSGFGRKKKASTTGSVSGFGSSAFGSSSGPQLKPQLKSSYGNSSGEGFGSSAFGSSSGPQLKPQLKSSYGNSSGEGDSPGEEPHVSPEIRDQRAKMLMSPDFLRRFCKLFAKHPQINDTNLFIKNFDPTRGICDVKLRARDVKTNSGNSLENEIRNTTNSISGGGLFSRAKSPRKKVSYASSGVAASSGVTARKKQDGITFLQSRPDLTQDLCSILEDFPVLYDVPTFTKPSEVKIICSGKISARQVKMSNGNSVAKHVTELHELAEKPRRTQGLRGRFGRVLGRGLRSTKKKSSANSEMSNVSGNEGPSMGMGSGMLMEAPTPMLTTSQEGGEGFFEGLFGTSNDRVDADNIVMPNGRPVSEHLDEISGESEESSPGLFGGKRRNKSKKSRGTKKSKKSRKSKTKKSRKSRGTRKPRTK